MNNKYLIIYTSGAEVNLIHAEDKQAMENQINFCTANGKGFNPDEEDYLIYQYDHQSDPVHYATLMNDQDGAYFKYEEGVGE